METAKIDPAQTEGDSKINFSSIFYFQLAE